MRGRGRGERNGVRERNGVWRDGRGMEIGECQRRGRESEGELLGVEELRVRRGEKGGGESEGKNNEGE